MKSKSYFQFGMKWDDIRKYVDLKVAKKIENRINSKYLFPSITLDSLDELAILLKSMNVIVNERNILRIIRETTRFEEADIIEDNIYELIPGSEKEEELMLEGYPSDYYELRVKCKYCGRYEWIQNLDLRLKSPMTLDIDETESGEILISDRLKNIVLNNELEGITFRKVIAKQDVWQMVSEFPATVKIPNEYIKEKDNCSYCGNPRIVIYEDTNGVELFKPPYDITRIERTPPLLLQNISGDFSVTNMEFGTIGRLPEGAPDMTVEEFTHKTSKPKWVASGKMCKILYKEKMKGFELSPAKFC